MTLIIPYEEYLVSNQFTNIFLDDTQGIYWPEIDLPEMAEEGTRVTINTFRKRNDEEEVPVGDEITVEYPLTNNERTYEPAGIRSYNGIRVEIKSTANITVKRILARDLI